MSTPVASKRPLSKISASSMSSPRLPVKVSRRRRGGGFGAGRAALDVHGKLFSSGFIAGIGERVGIGRAVIVGVRLGAGDDDAIVEPGAGQKPRDRQSADDPARRQRLDQFAPPAGACGW